MHGNTWWLDDVPLIHGWTFRDVMRLFNFFNKFLSKKHWTKTSSAMARESSGESRQAEAISCPKASSVQSFASFMAWYSLWPNKKIASQDSVITRPLHSCHCSADNGAHLGQEGCCFMQPHFDSRSSLLKSVHAEILCIYIRVYR